MITDQLVRNVSIIVDMISGLTHENKQVDYDHLVHVE